eukprot:6959099-Prymnesium_polylepis.2
MLVAPLVRPDVGWHDGVAADGGGGSDGGGGLGLLCGARWLLAGSAAALAVWRLSGLLPLRWWRFTVTGIAVVGDIRVVVADVVRGCNGLRVGCLAREAGARRVEAVGGVEDLGSRQRVGAYGGHVGGAGAVDQACVGLVVQDGVQFQAFRCFPPEQCLDGRVGRALRLESAGQIPPEAVGRVACGGGAVHASLADRML